MIKFTLTAYAADEMAFKVSVTEDDHGNGIDEKCHSCVDEDLDANGICERAKQAAEMRAQLGQGPDHYRKPVKFEVSLAAAEYAADEMDNAADICEGNIGYCDGANRMGYMSAARSYRTAEERIRAAMRAAAVQA